MRVFDPIPPRFSKVARQVGKCAESVYDRLGPGLLPNAYKGALEVELKLAGISYDRDVYLPLIYEGVRIEEAMYLDLIVEEAVLISILATPRHDPLDEMKLRTLLKFSELRIGLIINFDVTNFKQAIKKVSS